jgi:hypothetical protein
MHLTKFAHPICTTSDVTGNQEQTGVSYDIIKIMIEREMSHTAGGIDYLLRMRKTGGSPAGDIMFDEGTKMLYGMIFNFEKQYFITIILNWVEQHAYY